MFTDELQHQVGTMLGVQSKRLLEAQADVASSTFKQRSGQLAASLQRAPAINATRVTLSYPKYIRFLDMKKSRIGRRKVSGQIYNRPIYGYMVAGLRGWLIAAGSKTVGKMIEDTFEE